MTGYELIVVNLVFSVLIVCLFYEILVNLAVALPSLQRGHANRLRHLGKEGIPHHQKGVQELLHLKHDVFFVAAILHGETDRSPVRDCGVLRDQMCHDFWGAMVACQTGSQHLVEVRTIFEVDFWGILEQVLLGCRLFSALNVWLVCLSD